MCACACITDAWCEHCVLKHVECIDYYMSPRVYGGLRERKRAQERERERGKKERAYVDVLACAW